MRDWSIFKDTGEMNTRPMSSFFLVEATELGNENFLCSAPSRAMDRHIIGWSLSSSVFIRHHRLSRCINSLWRYVARKTPSGVDFIFCITHFNSQSFKIHTALKNSGLSAFDMASLILPHINKVWQRFRDMTTVKSADIHPIEWVNFLFLKIGQMKRPFIWHAVSYLHTDTFQEFYNVIGWYITSFCTPQISFFLFRQGKDIIYLFFRNWHFALKFTWVTGKTCLNNFSNIISVNQRRRGIIINLPRCSNIESRGVISNWLLLYCSCTGKSEALVGHWGWRRKFGRLANISREEDRITGGWYGGKRSFSGEVVPQYWWLHITAEMKDYRKKLEA